ncbi:MAG TPA: hypothetical protein VN634_17610 [Candidatus Limnocylindrales bacterium]|nr:hypothetical protein [Candidatus Limnocylindrales bacterium]
MLDDDAIARYARQIVIPAVGAAGQEKLLASTVLVVGNPRGCAQAALYLRAAGIRVTNSTSDGAFDLAIAADAASLDSRLRRELIESKRPVCWYALGENGFESGAYPDAELPQQETAPAKSDRAASGHDAAACDVASLACAILLRLPHRASAEIFEV